MVWVGAWQARGRGRGRSWGEGVGMHSMRMRGPRFAVVDVGFRTWGLGFRGKRSEF